jgi:hypothetical protein
LNHSAITAATAAAAAPTTISSSSTTTTTTTTTTTITTGTREYYALERSLDFSEHTKNVLMIFDLQLLYLKECAFLIRMF